MKRKTKETDTGVTGGSGSHDLSRPSHGRTRRSRTASAPVDDQEKQVRPSAKRKGKEKEVATMADSSSKTPTDGAARQRPKPKPRRMVQTAEGGDIQMDILSEPVSDGTTRSKQAPRLGEAEIIPSSSHGCCDTTIADSATTTGEVSSGSGQLVNDGVQNLTSTTSRVNTTASHPPSARREQDRANAAPRYTMAEVISSHYNHHPEADVQGTSTRLTHEGQPARSSLRLQLRRESLAMESTMGFSPMPSNP